jgi:hypothetical protein
VANFRTLLEGLYDGAISSYANGTAAQRAQAEQLREWVDSLAARMDDGEDVAEHAFIVGVALGRLVATNDYPAIEKYVRSLESAPQGIKEWHAKQKPGIDARNAKIDKYIAGALKVSTETADMMDVLRGMVGPDSDEDHQLRDRSLRGRIEKVKKKLKAGSAAK